MKKIESFLTVLSFFLSSFVHQPIKDKQTGVTTASDVNYFEMALKDSVADLPVFQRFAFYAIKEYHGIYFFLRDKLYFKIIFSFGF